MKAVAPIVQDLVLIGGGHSHAIALKQFGMNPLPGVRLTLITDVDDTPYSGMLPGYVAGLYTYEECHIDLRPLANFAGARLIRDRAIGLDLEHQHVYCAHYPAIAFDYLSIDIGSTPATLPVPGAKAYTTPVKPISKFLTYWDELVQEVTEHPDRPLRIGVVGGGAGGVELALSIQGRFSRIYQAAGQPPQNLQLHLIHRGDRLLPERTPWVGQTLQKQLVERGARLHLRQTVTQITLAESASSDAAIAPDPVNPPISAPKLLHCESGLTLECDRVFWVTQASAASWLQESGLATNSNGFVLVRDTLQSVSHPTVFAAGDVATLSNHPRPKAGVFAVRQGKPLFENLRRVLQGQPPQPFVPQKQFLILVGDGSASAIASRGIFHLGPHPLIWRWKDHIDRKFMAQFSNLEPMVMGGESGEIRSPGLSTPPPQPIPCAGCGSKVGAATLEKVLEQLRQEGALMPQREEVLVGLEHPDDAAVLRLPGDRLWVQTVDYFPALLSDPFLLGQITAQHCLNDLFAMGAAPHSALAIATLPYGTPAIQAETLYQLLSGTVKVLGQAGAALLGGHTIEGADLAFGLTCNGLTRGDRLLRKGGMKPGDVLILTKPLGTGTLFAADMRLKARGRWISGAIDSMLCSNQTAAQLFQSHHATACTDVTGFGLLGHLLEMVRPSGVTVELDLAAIPILEGADITIHQGILSSLHPQNLAAAAHTQRSEVIAHHPHYPLLFDPQTSGGLLAALPEAEAIACLTALQAQGYSHSATIGRVKAQKSAERVVFKA